MIVNKSHYSTTEAGVLFGLEDKIWAIRRTIDAMDLPVARIGLHRAIPREYLEELRAELIRRGYLKTEH